MTRAQSKAIEAFTEEDEAAQADVASILVSLSHAKETSAAPEDESLEETAAHNVPSLQHSPRAQRAIRRRQVVERVHTPEAQVQDTSSALSSPLSSAPPTPGRSVASFNLTPLNTSESSTTARPAVHCNRRTFPPGVPIDEEFPLFYRRFHVPSILPPQMRAEVLGGTSSQ